MTNEIIQHKEELPILMKSGLVHWVAKSTWNNISQILATQTAHGFIRVSELGNITVNTAEMEGAYTMAQYADICKVKQGMWQCEYKNWHNKGKRECECRKEYYRKKKEEEIARQQAEENKPVSEAERERQREMMTKSNEMWALDGNTFGRSMFQTGNKAGRSIRRSTIKEWEKNSGKKADIIGLCVE